MLEWISRYLEPRQKSASRAWFVEPFGHDNHGVVKYEGNVMAQVVFIIMRGLLAAAIMTFWLSNDHSSAQENGLERTGGGASFVEVQGAFPASRPWRPALPLETPKGALEPAFDNFDNFWTLASVEGSDHRRVLVLPAQDRSKWVEHGAKGLELATWRWIEPDEHGFVWVASERKLLRLYPRFPEHGWQDLTADPAFPSGNITAMSVGPNGSMLVALSTGKIVELDRITITEAGKPIERNRIRSADCPKGVQRMFADGQRVIWLDAAGKQFRSSIPLFELPSGENNSSPDVAAGASSSFWRLIARMPGNNHDLSGDVLDGKFYVAGGLTNGWGYPARDHAFSQLFEFNPRESSWRVAAELGYGRVYCTTTHLAGKVWVINGDVFEKDGSRRALTTVQIVDPSTGQVREGPATEIARPMPVAVNVDGRIYVAGNPRDRYDEPGCIESIGPGETTWRREPDGPTGLGALAACGLNGRFYVAVPEKHLAAFDVKTRTWSKIDVPHPPRSCQMASFEGEIWLMGGVAVPGWSHVQIYNPESQTWRTGPPLPRELAWGAAAEVEGKLIVTGGAGRHGNDWSYNNRTWVLNP